MTIHWGLFGPGLLLLLFPAGAMLSTAVELRSFESFKRLENSRRPRPWWWVPALWLDPVRGLFGTLLLQRAFEVAPDTRVSGPKLEYAALMGVLAAGVIFQTVPWRGDRRTLLAPVGFVVGMVLALTPVPVALLATAIAALGLFAFRQFLAFFAFGAAGVGVLGAALGSEMTWIGPAVGAFALPVVAALIVNGTLELPTRNASGPSRPSIPNHEQT